MATDLVSPYQWLANQVKREPAVTQFCVVDGCEGNLIGYETAIDLGLLHIVNSVSTPKVDNIIEDYKDCFEGLGKMKGKTAKLPVPQTTVSHP